MTNLINSATASISKPEVEKAHPTPLGFEIFAGGISNPVKEIVSDIFRTEEIQNLSNFTENNPWHDNENVLSHVQVVFANLQVLMSGYFLPDEAKQKLLEYLSQRPLQESKLSRAELLLTACALHDVSKGQPRPADDSVAPGKTYLFVKADGETSGKGHEHASSLMVPALLKGSGLTEEEINHIQYLVDYHDQYSLDYTNSNLSGFKNDGSIENDIIKIKSDQPDFAIELIMHIVADEWGAKVSQWKSEYLLNSILPKILF